MAFVHGKNTRVWIDGFDLSPYFNDVTLAAKVDLADTTTFAQTAGAPVAKTVIAGVTDGSINLKGMWTGAAQQASATSQSGTVVGTDYYFNDLISLTTGSDRFVVGQNIDTCVTVAPTGATAPGSRVWAAAGIVNSYQVSAPIKNVVSISAQIQADGGIDSGVSLKDPTALDAPNIAPCTITSGTTISGATITPTTGNPATTYPAAGSIAVPVTGGFQIIAYTGTTSTTFTGCSGGAGTAATGSILQVFSTTGVNDTVSPQGSLTTVAFTGVQVLADGGSITVSTNPVLSGFPQNGQLSVPTGGGGVSPYYTGITTSAPWKFLNLLGTTGASTTNGGSTTLVPVTSNTGAYALMHVGTGTGVSNGVAYAALQSSDDNSTWTTVSTFPLTMANSAGPFGTGQFAGTGIAGGYVLPIPKGIQIGRFVRTRIAYTATATNVPVLVSFVRL